MGTDPGCAVCLFSAVVMRAAGVSKAVLEPSARVDDKHACFLRRVALSLDRRVLR
jgi:hypothetical protein